MIEIIIAATATYGVSALVSEYSGPFDIFFRLRQRLRVLECTVCLSVWLAIPISIFSGLDIMGYFAVIGVIIIIEGLR